MKLSVTSIILLLTLAGRSQHDHDHSHHGHSHGEAVNMSAETYNSVEAATEKYEYVIHFQPFETEAEMSLYVSDFNSNLPLETGKIIVECVETGEKFNALQLSPGTFDFHVPYSDSKPKNFKIRMLFPKSDEVVIGPIAPGHKHEAHEETGDSGVPVWLTIILVAVGFCLGIGVSIWLNKKKTS